MPPTRTDDGLRAAQRIRAEQPGTAVVVLHVNGQYAAELLGERATAVGIADTTGFCRDLRRVAEGGVTLDPEVITAMPARRREVLTLIAGRSNAGIARVLGISEKSVVAHTSGIYAALGLAPDVDDRYLTR